MPMPDHGGSGYYWSSMSYSDAYYARFLDFSTHVYIDGYRSGFGRHTGFPLRCLAS